MDILDFVLLQDYTLRISGGIPGLVSSGSAADGARGSTDISASICQSDVSWFALPVYLGYEASEDVFIEYDELIPLVDNLYSLVYTIHDMAHKSSRTFCVNGEYADDIFRVTSVIPND